MRVRVEFYGILREFAGQQEWILDLPREVAVFDILEEARRAFPGLSRYPQEPVFTCGLDYVEPSHKVRDGETISILPAPPES